MIRVCSGWSPKGREMYGEAFLRGFAQHVDPDIQLQVYVEQAHPMPRMACRLLWDIPGAREFEARHRDNRAARGLESKPAWKRSAIEAGYNFRFDAYKFFRQILIPQAAAEDMADGDILIWLDGDVRITKPVSTKTLTRLLGDADVCYLGRDRSHSEIGFWAIRINDRTREFLRRIAEMFTSDAVFDLPEWHSAYVWDHVRRQMGMKECNLTPGGHGHVWLRSPLAQWSNHLKGKLKGRER